MRDRTEGDTHDSPLRTEHYAARSAETRALLDRDAAVFLHQALSTPCLDAVTSVQGATLRTLDGHERYDFHGNWVHQVGYAHPHVVAAVAEQVQRLAFSPRRYTNEVAVRLAERLVALAPEGLTRLLLAPGGAEAISIALQLARVATGRHKVISLWDSFHGATLDAISVGGQAHFRRGVGPLLPGVEHVPPPDPQRCPFGCAGTCALRCADYIDYVLEQEGDVAAVVAETVRSLPYIPPPDYWKRVRAACDRHGALLILDEIPTALGRTGRMFACEHYDVVPDLLVLGKGLGGGVMPLAAVLAREALNVSAHRSAGHFTHEKSPLACAAALATLDVIENERLLAQAVERGAQLEAGLQGLAARTERLASVRGLGLLWGVDVVDARGLPDADLAERILYASLEEGLSFKVTRGHTLLLLPPLTIRAAELRDALSRLERATTTALAQG